jgi:hypothetical protein
MKTKIEKEVRFLKIYALIATIVCSGILLTGFTSMTNNQKFGEIDVERINIVEADGELKMVISNQARQHPGIVNGKVIEREYPRPAGMIFFNHLGDEMGGFIFGENGETGHFGSLTFDKVKNDQTIGFRHLEGDDGTYTSALQMWQQPDIPIDVVMEKYNAAMKIEDEAERKAAIQKMRDNNELTTTRLFLGKSRDDGTYLLMSDLKGRNRIQLMVKPDGTPQLVFLDEEGEIIYSIPEKEDIE